MNTNELTGPALDWAVAKCEGYPLGIWYDEDELPMVRDDDVPEWQPSTDWSQGGPIIERESMHVDCLRKAGHYREAVWEAWPYASTKFIQQGPTPLIAAMRCYVASKLGDTVEIPEELK